MSEHKEPIPSMIYNASVGGHVTNSQQIIDENENKEQSQINAEVKQTLGQGGSVDDRIEQAKTSIIGGASSNGNTLKKLEDRVSPLESAVGSGGSVDSRISEAVATEASRAQAAEQLLQEQYNALTQSDIIVGTLPASGIQNKIYRVPGTTSYSDYMWNGSSFVKMAEYDNAIDDEPTLGSNNLVKSNGAANIVRATYGNIVFQTIITYAEGESDSYVLTIPATSANANQFGFTVGTFSVTLRIRGLGSQTVTVPKRSYLVATPGTGYIDVVDDSTLQSHHIILFSNFGGVLRNATGPIADYLRWLDTRNSLNYITVRNIGFGTKIKCTNIDPLTVYIPTHSNTRNDFGYFYINGSQVTLKCTVGGETFEIPRLYSLVASTSGWVSVTNDNEVIKNSIVLLFNPGGQTGTLETARGPLADCIRNIILLEDDEEVRKGVLPSYYDDYMQDKITAINNEEYNANSNIDSFVFITDTHDSHNTLKSPLMIKQIMQETSCRKMFYGGDAIWAYTSSASDTPADAKQQIIDGLILHNDAFVKPIIPVGSIFNARGNHDLTIRILNSDHSLRENLGYTFGHVASRNNMVRNELSLPNVYFNEDDNTCYYYIDNKNSKTRYLVCDGQSKPEIHVGNIAWGNDWAMGISDIQLAWIKESLLSIPDGYSLVVINHEGIVNETYPQNGYSQYSNLLNELVKLKNALYEYSEKTVNNVVVLSGHWHQDLQVYKDDVLHIGTASDVIDAYKDMFGYSVTRTRGTVTEQLFDYFINDFENNIIKVKRFGAGFDRTFHLNPVQLSVGGTATVVPILEASSYVSYDTSGNTYNSGTWTLSNTIVSVNNGVVTALQEGSAIVVAIDDDGNKEFFYIKVV